MLKARILEKSEKNKWDQFIQSHPLATIHQTSQWGHFQAQIAARGKYWIIALESSQSTSLPSTVPYLLSSRKGESSSSILAGTLLIRHKLPRGYSWLYASRGPLLNFNLKDNYKFAKQQMEILLDEIKKIARKEKAIFFRIDPPINNPHPCHFPRFHQNIQGFQPEHTLMLDLTMSEDELLKQMKPKGRYNIKLAAKKGIKIRKADPSNPEKFQNDLKNFYKILQETTTRDGFHGHDPRFYEQMLNSLNLQNSTQNSTQKSSATLYLAEFKNEIIAASINTNYKDTATYYYGASGNVHRNLMAPYLLHWEAIKEAKKQNYKFYDFFGISPSGSKKHPWLGVTDFKKKFGGQEISYQPAQEYVFKPILYRLYKAYKKLRFLL